MITTPGRERRKRGPRSFIELRDGELGRGRRWSPLRRTSQGYRIRLEPTRCRASHPRRPRELFALAMTRRLEARRHAARPPARADRRRSRGPDTLRPRSAYEVVRARLATRLAGDRYKVGTGPVGARVRRGTGPVPDG